MKLFTLFSGKSVHKSAGQKVIPAEEFQTAMSAAEVLEEAKKEEQEHREKVAKECEQLKEQAKEEGFQEGLEKLNKKILKLDKVITSTEKDVHEQILPLAIQAAKKILGEELKLHPDRIVEIVLQALKPVTQHHYVTIYVNKNDLKRIEKGKSSIKKTLQQVQSLSLQEREDIEDGGCIIETEAGIINAQLENQWRALETAFEAFMKK